MQSEIREVLSKGILAPSGDNMQPWRFRVCADGGVDLSIESSSHAEHFFDVGHRTTYLSAGAVIENMRVAGQGIGLGLRANYFPDKDNELHVAHLTFENIEQSKHPHEAALQSRCTNRKFYNTQKAISEATFEKINQTENFEKGYKLLWCKRTEHKYKKLCRLVGEGDQIRFENERIHREFAETLRYQKNPEEGLDVRTLEVGPAAHILFQFISSWNRLNLLNRFGLSRSMNQFSERQMHSSQAAGLVVTPTHSRIDYVKGGEMMERVWHELTLQGLSVQPMEGIPVFLINLKLEGGSAFPKDQLKQVKELGKRFYSLFDISDENGLILFFRAGYARPPATRSKRKPLASFIES